MTRYFLHVTNGEDRCLDPDGDVSPDLAAARTKAVEYARELLSNEVKKGRMPLEHYIEISSPNGEVIHTVQFFDAADITCTRT